MEEALQVGHLTGKESTVLAYDLIEKLLVNVDLYHLRCLPDQGAVELVYQCAV
jgi:hypothetical protein